MSAKQKLCCIVTAALLVAGCSGCSANMHQPDSLSDDTTTQIATSANTPLSTSTGVQTIKDITPDNRTLVVEKNTQNRDAVGWIYVPGTEINQVVVRTPYNQDNDYYLNRNFEGLPDRNGTYCTDRRSQFGQGRSSQLSRNTPVYGHSWTDDPDGTLFSQLKRYRDPEFAREHPYVFFSTANDNMAWEVFAVFDATTDLLYNVPDLSDSLFFETMEWVYDASIYNYDIAVGPEDKIITLSTCVYSVDGHDSLPMYNDYRFAVMARLVKHREPAKDSAVFVVNEYPLPPDSIVDLVDYQAAVQFRHSSSMA